ncbi:MAG: RNA methyltransferase [Spirochaetales bacterium]|nr:RNA methyltransferase [Spirochaetales bacterium]
MEWWNGGMMECEVYGNLTDRDLKKEGIFIGEGRYVVERMIQAGCDILSILCLPEYTGYFTGLAKGRYPVIEKTKDEVSRLTGFRFHRGVIAAAERSRLPGMDTYLAALPGKAVLAVLPSISEAENAGSIMRSASAFSLDGVITGPGCIDLFSRKAIRCSMGAVFDMPVLVFQDHREAIAIIHRHGFHITGTTLSAKGKPLEGFHFPGKCALVFGHEADGLTAPWDTACDTYVTIPISSRVDSLNVGIAAGILFYLLRNR